MLGKHYAKVKGIVHKCRKDYYLHLWEKDDWDQEGMICLYELLEHHPEVVEEEKKLTPQQLRKKYFLKRMKREDK